MNARRTKKYLKKQIYKLQSDNDLMRRIIADSPDMQSLYDAFNRPSNVTQTTMLFQEYKTKRVIPFYMADYMADVEGIIEHTKQAVAKDLFESIKEHITYEVDTEDMTPTMITASIIIGRK